MLYANGGKAAWNDWAAAGSWPNAGADDVDADQLDLTEKMSAPRGKGFSNPGAQPRRCVRESLLARVCTQGARQPRAADHSSPMAPMLHVVSTCWQRTVQPRAA